MKKTIKNTYNLSFNIFLINVKKWQNILITILPFFVLLFSNSMLSFFVSQFNNLSDFLILKNIFIIINSISILIFSLFLYVHLFVIQSNNGYYKMELRFGYKLGEIFFARIFYIYIMSLLVFSLMILQSVVFFAAFKNNDISFIYNIFISQLGWYAIIIFLFPLTGLVMTILFKSVASIIASTLTNVFLVIAPALTIFLHLAFEQKYSWPQLSDYNNAISINIRNSIKKEFSKNEVSLEIYNELSSLQLSTLTPEIYYGVDYWIKNDLALNEQVTTYNKFITEVDKIIDHEYFKWSDHKEFNLSSKMGQEKPNKLLNDLKEKTSKEFLPVIEIYEKYLNNWNIIKFIINDSDTLFSPMYSEGIIQDEFKNKPSLFMFVKTFNFLVYSSINQVPFSFNVIEVESPFKKIERKEQYLLWSNLINPIHHFNLMYNSTNYSKNSMYFDSILASLPFYNKVINLKISTSFISDDPNDLPVIKIKTLIPTEIIYIFYFIGGNLVIWLIYVLWRKKTKL